jgi:hypothetical protein
MSSRFARLAAAVASCFACVGCGGGLQCGNGCNSPSPYAFQKYEACCETCGPNGCGQGGAGCACGDNVGCGDGCTTCGGAGCDACAGGCAGGCGRGPLGCFRRLCSLLDCAGCGECYWNEWYNDPPVCKDACDCYGNWVGVGAPGYFRAPYRSQHGWLANQNAAPAAQPLTGASPSDQPPSSLAALDAAAASISQPASVEAAPAVYDDAVLDPKLQ